MTFVELEQTNWSSQVLFFFTKRSRNFTFFVHPQNPDATKIRCQIYLLWVDGCIDYIGNGSIFWMQGLEIILMESRNFINKLQEPFSRSITTFTGLGRVCSASKMHTIFCVMADLIFVLTWYFASAGVKLLDS